MSGDVGRELRVRCDDQDLMVTDRGAGLRSYTVGGRPVLDGCAPDAPCTAGRGHILLPWPNRIAGAVYRFDGVEHRLPVTEARTGAAIHGLTRNESWTVLEHHPDQVRLRYDLSARPGYPFALRLEVDHALGPTGLRVWVSATNTGDVRAPYAAGAHPYLAAGTGQVDQLTVQIPASRYYPTDERGIPTGCDPVDGTPYDLRVAAALGERRIDHAYTGLRRDPDGRARVRLRTADGWAAALWMDGAHDYLQVFTGDTVPELERRRRGLAVEPMTAAPNAFRTGDGLTVLEPGATHVAEWGIEPF